MEEDRLKKIKSTGLYIHIYIYMCRGSLILLDSYSCIHFTEFQINLNLILQLKIMFF